MHNNVFKYKSYEYQEDYLVLVLESRISEDSQNGATYCRPWPIIKNDIMNSWTDEARRVHTFKIMQIKWDNRCVYRNVW